MISLLLTGGLGFNALVASGWLQDARPWAGSVNALLLIVLAIIGRRQHHETLSELKDTHADVGHAANAAASAAQAAAESARVVKDIGSTLRQTEIPPVPKPRKRSTAERG